MDAIVHFEAFVVRIAGIDAWLALPLRSAM
jgi:hypothetical protein